MSEYYRSYEERYRAVREIGDYLWGHQPDDHQLIAALNGWMDEYGLRGKRIVEFACGEGVCAEMLLRMGCMYQGYDIAPTAVAIARRRIADFPHGQIDQLDMVKDVLPANTADGVLDVSGFHMLVTDGDRRAYLANVSRILKPGASALFYQESYRKNAYEGEVSSIEDWQRITGCDFSTPEPRRIVGSDKEVMLRLLPARPKNREGYQREFVEAGFEVIRIEEIEGSDFMATSAAILVRKPQ